MHNEHKLSGCRKLFVWFCFLSNFSAQNMKEREGGLIGLKCLGGKVHPAMQLSFDCLHGGQPSEIAGSRVGEGRRKIRGNLFLAETSNLDSSPCAVYWRRRDGGLRLWWRECVVEDEQSRLSTTRQQ